MIRSSKKARTRRSLVLQLDALARAACFARDHHLCVRCGSSKVQWCHVIGRRHLSTRWEEDNNLSMCAGCHMWWHEYPLLSGPWFRKNWSERAEHILKLFNAGGKVDLKEKLAEFIGGPVVRLPYEPIKDEELPF